MSRPRLALPWYVHPAEAPREWNWLAARRDVAFAVVNVHNGPGTENDAYYPDALALLRGIRTLGYVPVHYGERSVTDVAAEIDHWQRRYRVDGIMLDELPATDAGLASCTRYAGAARAAGVPFLAANPGTFPPRAVLDLFDVTGVFEGTAESYAGFRHPAWAWNVPPHRLWHLVYGCAPQRIAAVADRAGRHGAGYVFATDRSLPNPWLGPPTAVSDRLGAGHPVAGT
ncbi:hypothetical protein GD627_14395 [Arthrobacter yangruifuii]|uniref:Spherulation-specific family 4 n=1 Tax=Arthrobacter yangruifuii TaxID=2606616 RepID=A0A5N6MH06_9MICC|nr:spherulation-specific family 4 protein [Arthrobacter yangruifuii]KAD3515440.1 hypothetical protein GD627_14395 [Arthrobacter yangruifuii]